jgi:N-acetylglutamate synthase-like GNAT family acetyltransferase
VEVEIREATLADIDELVRLDTTVPHDSTRKSFIRKWVEAGECYVAVKAGRIVGCGVLNYSFFHLGNVEMLVIHAEFRQQGIGRKLLRLLETRCKTEKFWVTTNLFNQPMQKLLASEGFVLSGFVDNLDLGDPELIFFKKLEKPQK